MTCLLAKTDTLTWVVLAMGVLVLAFTMMRASRQRIARQAREASGEPMPEREAVRAAGQIHGQLDELMVQLEEMARTATAQIDTRFAKLEALLAQADEKIARLESLLAAAEGKAPPARPPAGPPEVRPEHRAIHELADAGRSPVEIARQVGRDVGEVELILALRKKG